MDSLLRPAVFLLCIGVTVCCRRRPDACQPAPADIAQDPGRNAPGSNPVFSLALPVSVPRQPISELFADYEATLVDLGMSPGIRPKKVFRMLDEDGNKRVNLGEWMARGGELLSFSALLSRYDKDDDLEISMKEALKINKHHARMQNQA